MKQFVFLLCLTACGLSHTQVKQITQDAAEYALCAEICVQKSETDTEFKTCMVKCDKTHGIDSEGVLTNVARDLR